MGIRYAIAMKDAIVILLADGSIARGDRVGLGNGCRVSARSSFDIGIALENALRGDFIKVQLIKAIILRDSLDADSILVKYGDFAERTENAIDRGDTDRYVPEFIVPALTWTGPTWPITGNALVFDK
jgi:hypothetical protein